MYLAAITQIESGLSLDKPQASRQIPVLSNSVGIHFGTSVLRLMTQQCETALVVKPQKVEHISIRLGIFALLPQFVQRGIDHPAARFQLL
jgi:hypothetical protein